MTARRFAERRGAAPLAALAALLVGGDAAADTYWQRFLSCLLADSRNAGREAECRALVTRLQTQVTRAAASTAAITGGHSCQTDTEYFNGEGFVVDRVSCGPRVASPACSVSSPSAACPPDSAFPTPADTAGSPLATWCPDCVSQSRVPLLTGERQPTGCYVCESRDDVTRHVANSAHDQIRQLFACFGRADPSRPDPHSRRSDGTYGPFPNRALLRKLQQTYQHFLAQGGVTLKCPGDDRTRDGRLRGGYARADEGAIFLEPGGVYDTSTLAHEFMHLTSATGSGGIDDQNGATHNHPADTCPHDVDANGVERRDTSRERPMPNRHYDRVYACENLCFSEGFVTADECSRCLSYPDAPKTGGQMPAQCRGLMTLRELAAYEAAKRSANQDTGECESRLRTELAQLRSRRIFNGALGTEGASMTVIRPAVLDAATGSCVSAYEGPVTQADAILSARPDDPRNRDNLRVERFTYAFKSVRYKLIRACAYRSYFQEMRRQCVSQAIGRGREAQCDRAIDQTMSRNKERTPAQWDAIIGQLRTEWNELRAQAATPIGGTSFSAAEITPASASQICAGIPRLPSMTHEMSDAIRVSPGVGP